MKKLSDEEIISRGPSPATKDAAGSASITAILAVGALICGCFAIGAVTGAGLALAGGAGIIGFVSGLATGGLWGGITGAGILGALCGVGEVVDRRADKKAKTQDAAYAAAMARKRAVETVPRAAKFSDRGTAKDAFAKDTLASTDPADVVRNANAPKQRAPN